MGTFPVTTSILPLLVLLVFGCGSASASKPNVLLIMADDLRDFGGAFTKEVVKTPNLDRLRARGTTFERAYVQYPVCNPSRSSMMTGLRAEQTGIVGNDIAAAAEDAGRSSRCRNSAKKPDGSRMRLGSSFTSAAARTPRPRQRWMDAGRSWHTAQAFEATQDGPQAARRPQRDRRRLELVPVGRRRWHGRRPARRPNRRRHGGDDREARRHAVVHRLRIHEAA